MITGIRIYDLILSKNIMTKEDLDQVLNPFEMTKPGIAGKNLLNKK